MAGGTGAVLLGRSQSEWRGDPQITRRFLDFLKVGFKNENFIHKQFWRKKTHKNTTDHISKTVALNLYFINLSNTDAIYVFSPGPNHKHVYLWGTTI